MPEFGFYVHSWSKEWVTFEANDLDDAKQMLVDSLGIVDELPENSRSEVKGGEEFDYESLVKVEPLVKADGSPLIVDSFAVAVEAQEWEDLNADY